MQRKLAPSISHGDYTSPCPCYHYIRLVYRWVLYIEAVYGLRRDDESYGLELEAHAIVNPSTTTQDSVKKGGLHVSHAINLTLATS